MAGTVEEAFEANRRRWDELADVHRRDASGFYGVERFLAGESDLTPIERAEVGDLGGRRVAHLQCHFGMDTIRLARHGAAVTGLDFSQTAIAEGRRLAAQLGSEASFVLGNVYDARELLSDDFDLVFTTWGTIVWLPDLGGWARVIASLLRPGGALYFADAHPMLLCHEAIDGRLVLSEDWQTPPERPLIYTDSASYSGDATAEHTSYQWIHSLGGIVDAISGAGLQIEWVHEHGELPWRQLPTMSRGSDGMFRLPPDGPRIPAAVSIRAVKPA
jgi:SAM-dependent methyltransferase